MKIWKEKKTLKPPQLSIAQAPHRREKVLAPCLPPATLMSTKWMDGWMLLCLSFLVQPPNKLFWWITLTCGHFILRLETLSCLPGKEYIVGLALLLPSELIQFFVQLSQRGKILNTIIEPLSRCSHDTITMARRVLEARIDFLCFQSVKNCELLFSYWSQEIRTEGFLYEPVSKIKLINTKEKSILSCLIISSMYRYAILL